jgi:[ribosomal protein S18]-alanine N-acetyltransferase
MSQPSLLEMVNWRYGSPFEFYDGDGVLPRNPERFFEARNEDDEFVGFYYFEGRDDALFYGVGLRPERIGKGDGFAFVCAGLEFGRRHFMPSRVTLDVAAFNVRAKRVYERAGFRTVSSHIRHFERWGDVEFIDMEKAMRSAKPGT